MSLKADMHQGGPTISRLDSKNIFISQHNLFVAQFYFFKLEKSQYFHVAQFEK